MEKPVVTCARNIEGPFVVIGDVHGHMEALEDLIGILEREVGNITDRWIVFVAILWTAATTPEGP